ncbi:MAG: MFS transporter [Dermatophilaceae bacterium]
MGFREYQRVLAVRDTRTALILGFFIRVPMWAGGVILTLHVVAALDRSYGEAGLVAAAMTLGIAISGPWRGRLLDRIGLRRTVAPSLLVQLVCWSIAPWVGYAPLVGLAALAGLFVVPTFSILRQVILRSVPPTQRRTALSLDSAGTELSFMAGPAIGVWLATTWDTGIALFASQMAAVVAGLVLWLVNPALRGDAPEVVRADAGADVADDVADDVGDDVVADARETAVPNEVLVTVRQGGVREAGVVAEPAPRWAFRGFITLPVAAIYLAAFASTIILTGTDVSVVAALRSYDRPEAIGWVLALWGAGSLVGGLIYGLWQRSISVYWLLGLLAAVTLPVALAVGVSSFAALLLVSGLFCAPTVTATVEHLSRVVPERFRGEMMGWHGSAMTAGSAFGAPAAGVAIDRGGWQWGFLSVSLIGLAVALAGMIIQAWRRRGPQVLRGTPARVSRRVRVGPRGQAISGEPVPAANLEH